MVAASLMASCLYPSASSPVGRRARPRSLLATSVTVSRRRTRRAVWLYFRFTLSLRNVEELMPE